MAEVCDLLRCSRCSRPLDLLDGQVGCPAGHRFDVARQGYVNLLSDRPPPNADTAAMVQARVDFLGAGHYRPLVDALPVPTGAEVILDSGAGPGTHLAGVLDRTERARGLAVDVSVPACRRAAGAHPRMGAVVGDVWRSLPVRDQVADLIMVVFAPRNFAEFARVLRPDGRLVVVTPEPDHLVELVTALGLLAVDADKEGRLRRDAAMRFEQVTRRVVRFGLRLSAPELGQLVAMGPNAFHVDLSALAARTAALAPLSVTVSCAVTELAPLG